MGGSARQLSKVISRSLDLSFAASGVLHLFQLWKYRSYVHVAGTIQQHATKLQHLGVDPAAFERDIASMRALQSERAGVSMRYLLSIEFMELATKRTGKGNGAEG